MARRDKGEPLSVGVPTFPRASLAVLSSLFRRDVWFGMCRAIGPLVGAKTWLALAPATAEIYRVVFVKRMPVQAVGLTSILRGWSFATKDVDTPGNRLNVAWVDAISDPAEVVEFHAFGNWANFGFVDKTVNGMETTLEFESAIAISEMANPQPTVIRPTTNYPPPNVSDSIGSHRSLLLRCHAPGRSQRRGRTSLSSLLYDSEVIM